MLRDIGKDEQIECLGRLRDTRALILRDSEAFHEAVVSLEHVAQILSRAVRPGLKHYEPELLALITSGNEHEERDAQRLLTVVRHARNSAVHDGAWARHLSSRLVDLFLMLEEALVEKMTLVGDVMVRTPVVAEPWHLVAHVRKSMLANSFSFLPLFLDGRWRIVSDVAVMRYLQSASGVGDRRARLAKQLKTIIETEGFPTTEAVCCSPGETIHGLLRDAPDGPVLVTQQFDGEHRLLGLIMPFDLL